MSIMRTKTKSAAGILMALFLLGGCEFVDESLLPAVTGESAATIPLGDTQFASPGVTDGAPTGTAVGEKVSQLRGDLGRLQSEINEENAVLQQLRGQARNSAAFYHGLVAAINARLQVGTTPGNPELVAQWQQAQQELDRVAASISQMTGLLSDASATSALAGYLLEATAATFTVRGAIEEDHRQLAVLQDETSKTAVVIDRLLNELSEDIARATAYVNNERANMTAMAVAIDNGEYMGTSMATRVAGAPSSAPIGGGASYVGAREPLVVIRFDRATVDYQAVLADAVQAALERRPNAAFDIVAVAPGGGNAAANAAKARQYAEEVLRTLLNLGLPADRMTLSATASPNAQVNEVHVYVR